MADPQRRIEPISLLVLVLVLALLPLLGKFAIHLGSLAGIMVILALGLHVFFGIAGQINFGISGSYACGAYAAALLINKGGLHFFAALPLALIIVGVITVILGAAVLRLRHWVLALGTASFGLAVWLTARTVAVGFLGGDDGLDLPSLRVGGWKAGPLFYYYFITAWAIVGLLASHFLGHSRAGRALKAIREDEVAASAMGVHVSHYVRVAFLLCGLYAGMAGILYAQWNGWISPASFTLDVSMYAVVFVIVGGLGFGSGAVVGAALLTLLPQLLVPLREYHVLVYAVILFLVIRFAPKGIVGSLRDVWFRLRPGLAPAPASRG
ncbi:MAG: branched-chain amino acid ABC transporter permease [Candidatus Rokubacteria bacterium]|nr:branched-chain amino acid ABC transporter permease [Candidatus Rokubacteria bacterium]